MNGSSFFNANGVRQTPKRIVGHAVMETLGASTYIRQKREAEMRNTPRHSGFLMHVWLFAELTDSCRFAFNVLLLESLEGSAQFSSRSTEADVLCCNVVGTSL